MNKLGALIRIVLGTRLTPAHASAIKKTGPREGGRLGFSCRLLPLEAPARHAGVEHGHGAVNDVGQLGVWGIEKQHEDGG
jgi:hypothetical protein